MSKEKLDELLDNDFITNSNTLWLLALMLLIFDNSYSQDSGTTINIYFNDEKEGGF